MKPLQSSYTMSSTENSKNNDSGAKNTVSQTKISDINNKGGRPALPDEEKSEKTQANIASMG